ncbi:MAG: SufD family Fe-S cluster assembly protein [Pseudomonadota bacterium]
MSNNFSSSAPNHMDELYSNLSTLLAGQNRAGLKKVESFRHSPFKRLKMPDRHTPKTRSKTLLPNELKKPGNHDAILYIKDRRWQLDQAGEYQKFINIQPFQFAPSAWGSEHLAYNQRFEQQPGQILAGFNLLALTETLTIHLPKDFKSDQVLHIVNMPEINHQDPQSAQSNHIRVHIKLEKGAHLDLVEWQGHVDSNAIIDHSSTQSNVIECDVGEHACANHLLLQHGTHQITNLNTRRYKLFENAHLRLSNLSSNAYIQRIETHVAFHASSAHTSLAALCFLNHKNHCDQITWFDHLSPNCTSSQSFRGILDERASANIQGKISIAEHCNQTNADQNIKTLMLSDHAQVEMKPELEILSHDVQCTHGATMSDLDPEMLYYLASRGIQKEQAQYLLLEGFLKTALINDFPENMNTYLETYCSTLLAQAIKTSKQ